MEMMWNRVVRGNVLPDEYTDYKQLEEKMDCIMDPDNDGKGSHAYAWFYGKYLLTLHIGKASCNSR